MDIESTGPAKSPNPWNIRTAKKGERRNAKPTSLAAGRGQKKKRNKYVFHQLKP